MLRIDCLVKRFGGLTVTDGLSLELVPGELHALIGPNGAGKTTLLNLLAGELSPDEGRILLDGVDITALPPWRRALAGMARSFQISSVFAELSVIENVLASAQASRGLRLWRDALRRPDIVGQAQAALSECGLGGRGADRVSRLSHGERRQLELAMALAAGPRLLLLDEPMAGMGTHDSQTVIALLHRLKGQYTTVLVEHDMDAVFTLADRISVLFYGRVLVTGTVDEIRGHPAVREAYLGTEETHP